MSNIIVKENESLDSALRRFKRSCAKAGIQQEIRKREHYEKPSVRRKKKSEAARKRKYKLLCCKKSIRMDALFLSLFTENMSFRSSLCEREMVSLHKNLIDLTVKSKEFQDG